MPNCRELVFFCGISILLAACAGNPEAADPAVAGPKQPHQYLDGQSGATVALPDKPLLFAHDRGEHGADLRDYVTFNGATVDQAGKRNCLLIAYAWSTLDARHEPERPVPDSLVLVADDRRIAVDASGGSPAQFGIIHLVGAPAGRTVKTFCFEHRPRPPSRLLAARGICSCRPALLGTRWTTCCGTTSARRLPGSSSCSMANAESGNRSTGARVCDA